MIDYEMLCQTIEDWRAGRRPSIDLSATPAGAAHEYAEAEADHDYVEPHAGEGQYAEEPYADEEYAAEPEADYGEERAQEVDVEAGYEDVPAADYEDEYEYDDDGAPEPVATGGTAPVVLGEDLEDER